MNVQNLNIFCNYYKIPFPVFNINLEPIQNSFVCKLYTINGNLILQSNYNISENDSIIEAIHMFYEFCLIEKNFLFLIENSRNIHMDIDK